MMARWVSFVVVHRKAVLAIIVSLSCLACYASRTLRFQFQFRDFYDYPHNDDLAPLKRASEDFGDPAGNVVVLLQAPDVFDAKVLGYVKELTAAIAASPSFTHTDSLATVRSVRSDGDGVTSGPVADPVPTTAEALSALRQFATSDPLLAHRLVAPDGTATAILAELKTPLTLASIAEQEEGLASVRAALAAHPPPPAVRVTVTGAPAVEVETTRALMLDQMRLTPGVLLVLVIALYLAFRSAHGILLALASVSAATVWTAGIFALLGRPVDIIGSLIPTTILVYGVVDPVFVLTRFLQKLDVGKTRREAIVEALSELALPCVLTSLTTALGFAMFITSSAPTVRTYGLTVAIGVALSWITTVTLLPALLASVAPPKKRFDGSAMAQRMDRVLAAVWRLTRGRRVIVVVATLAILAGGAIAAKRARVVNVYVAGLPEGTVRSQVRELEKALTGVVRFAVYLEGDEDVMRRPDVLSAMQRIQESAKNTPLVTYTSSLAGVVAQMNHAFAGGASDEDRRVPASRALIAQYLSLLGPADRSRLVTDDYSRSQIAVLATDEGSVSAARIASNLNRAIDESGIRGLGVRATITGAGYAAYRGLDEVVREIVHGFLAAFLVVVVVGAVFFRSARLALVSAIPNLVPLALCFLTLAVLHLDLRLDSSLFLGVSIGGLFNTTIHLAARIRQGIRGGEKDVGVAIDRALRAVGPAALFTSAILSAGFSVLMISKFPGLQVLGVLTMVTLVAAVLADIVISPVLFEWLVSWRREPR